MKLHRYASGLPGSAGWVLLELLETPVNGIGQLMDSLNLGERTIERAVADLEKLGLCQRDNRAVTLAHDALERCANPVAQSVQSPSQSVNTTRSEAAQNLSPDVNTASASFATELTNNVQHASDDPASRAHPRVVFDLSSKTTSTPKTKKPKEAKSPPNADAPPKPRSRDEMFDAIATASFGGLEGLTAVNAAQVGKAKRDLEAAGYSPEDVWSIGAWVKKIDLWRNGTVSPQVLVQRATAWRNAPNASEKTNGLGSRMHINDPDMWAAEEAAQEAAVRALGVNV